MNLMVSLLASKNFRRDRKRCCSTVISLFMSITLFISASSFCSYLTYTLSTNVALRRREFAMLKSIGILQKDFHRMMSYEYIIYCIGSLMWGLPSSVVLTYIIWRISGITYENRFYIPWQSIVIAAGSVFAIVFAAILYATKKLWKDNPIDALKTENL